MNLALPSLLLKAGQEFSEQEVIADDGQKSYACQIDSPKDGYEEDPVNVDKDVG